MVLLVAGAPGTGKSSLCAALQASLEPSCPTSSSAPSASRTSCRTGATSRPRRNNSAWENLSFAVRNYVKHGFTPVLVTDLRDERVAVASAQLADIGVLIVTLVVDSVVIDARIRARTEGFTDASAAVTWNEAVRARNALANEIKVDATRSTVADLCHQVMQHLAGVALTQRASATSGRVQAKAKAGGRTTTTAAAHRPNTGM